MSARAAFRVQTFRAVLAAGVLGALLTPLALGYFASRLNFTYGTGGLDPSERWRAAVRVAAWIVAGLAFEAVFRRGLLGRLRARLPLAAAIVAHQLVLNAIMVPLIVWYDVRTDVLSIPQVVLYENLLQVLFTLITLATGSIWLSGLLQGLFAALRVTLINDVSGPFETLFFSAYSDSVVGWAITLSPVLGSLWVWLMAWVLRAPIVARGTPIDRPAEVT